MSTSDEGLREACKALLVKFHENTVGDWSGDPWEEHPYQDAGKLWFFDDDAKELAELIQSDRRQFLDRIAGQLPENKTRKKNLADIEKHELFQFNDNPRLRKLIGIGRINGYNTAIDEVRSILAKERERLAGIDKAREAE